MLGHWNELFRNFSISQASTGAFAQCVLSAYVNMNIFHTIACVVQYFLWPMFNSIKEHTRTNSVSEMQVGVLHHLLHLIYLLRLRVANIWTSNERPRLLGNSILLKDEIKKTHDAFATKQSLHWQHMHKTYASNKRSILLQSKWLHSNDHKRKRDIQFNSIQWYGHTHLNTLNTHYNCIIMCFSFTNQFYGRIRSYVECLLFAWFKPPVSYIPAHV